MRARMCRKWGKKTQTLIYENMEWTLVRLLNVYMEHPMFGLFKNLLCHSSLATHPHSMGIINNFGLTRKNTRRTCNSMNWTWVRLIFFDSIIGLFHHKSRLVHKYFIHIRCSFMLFLFLCCKHISVQKYIDVRMFRLVSISVTWMGISPGIIIAKQWQDKIFNFGFSPSYMKKSCRPVFIHVCKVHFRY